MEIEILTTKKKLTKAMIKQFKPATLLDMQHIEGSGFYVRDLGAKYGQKVAVFRTADGWRRIDLRETKMRDVSSIYLGAGVMFFNSQEERDEWLDAYKVVKYRCNRHVII